MRPRVLLRRGRLFQPQGTWQRRRGGVGPRGRPREASAGRAGDGAAGGAGDRGTAPVDSVNCLPSEVCSPGLERRGHQPGAVRGPLRPPRPPARAPRPRGPARRPSPTAGPPCATLRPGCRAPVRVHLPHPTSQGESGPSVYPAAPPSGLTWSEGLSSPVRGWSPPGTPAQGPPGGGNPPVPTYPFLISGHCCEPSRLPSAALGTRWPQRGAHWPAGSAEGHGDHCQGHRHSPRTPRPGGLCCPQRPPPRDRPVRPHSHVLCEWPQQHPRPGTPGWAAWLPSEEGLEPPGWGRQGLAWTRFQLL